MLSDENFNQICEECSLQTYKLSELTTALTDKVTEQGYTVVSESQLTAMMTNRSAQDSIALNFLSTGRVNNFTPAIIKAEKQQTEVVRYSSDYQSPTVNIEQSLQALSGMPFCSIFDDDLVSLLVKLLTLSQTKTAKVDEATLSKVLIPSTVSPVIRHALRCQLKHLNIDLVVLDYDKASGCVALAQLEAFDADDVLAVVLAWPNFFGQLEDISQISEWVEKSASLLIGISNTVSLSYLKSPFTLSHGKLDYLLGDLQAMGLAVNQGGHSPTFLASRDKQADEFSVDAVRQEFTRDLNVIQSYLSVTGLSGLHQSVQQSNEMLRLLVEKLTVVDGVTKRFLTDNANECVIEIAQIDIEKALKILSGHNMVLGYLLQDDYPELSNCLLVYCSDQHTLNDVEKLAGKVATVVKNLSTAGCPVKPKF